MSRNAPAVFTHVSQKQWGRGVVVAVKSDRTTYVFESGGERTFPNGHGSIVEIPLPATERAALADSLLSRRRPVGGAKPLRPKRRVPAITPLPQISFERQIEIFAARYPRGFADPAYLAEQRGTASGPGRRQNAGLSLARDLLSAAKLDLAIARGAFDAVLDSAVAVVTAFESLSLPKGDKPMLQRLPASAHEKFAVGLRALLHGTGDYTSRFDAFVAALEMSEPPWTLATVFSAALDPSAHVFVKSTVSQRQARALGLADPPLGTPTGAGYAQHLAVSLALRQRLVAAGLEPRDLFDVYAFGWRTLTRSAQASHSGRS